MDWIQTWVVLMGFLTLIIAVFGMFLIVRAEVQAGELNTQNLIKDSERNTQNLIIAIKDEIKDFHGRLCAIEERRKG